MLKFQEYLLCQLMFFPQSTPDSTSAEKYAKDIQKSSSSWVLSDSNLHSVSTLKNKQFIFIYFRKLHIKTTLLMGIFQFSDNLARNWKDNWTTRRQ